MIKWATREYYYALILRFQIRIVLEVEWGSNEFRKIFHFLLDFNL